MLLLFFLTFSLIRPSFPCSFLFISLCSNPFFPSDGIHTGGLHVTSRSRHFTVYILLSFVNVSLFSTSSLYPPIPVCPLFPPFRPRDIKHSEGPHVAVGSHRFTVYIILSFVPASLSSLSFFSTPLITTGGAVKEAPEIAYSCYRSNVRKFFLEDIEDADESVTNHTTTDALYVIHVGKNEVQKSIQETS